METNDLLTIIILVVIAVAVGIILSSLDNKKVCAQQICEYQTKCSQYCDTINNCPECPSCDECPLIRQEILSAEQESVPENTIDGQETVLEGTVIEPIDMTADNLFEKPMYVSVMDTDIKSSCGGFDKTEPRQQVLGAPFPSNYKPMMIF